MWMVNRKNSNTNSSRNDIWGSPTKFQAMLVRPGQVASVLQEHLKRTRYLRMLANQQNTYNVLLCSDHVTARRQLNPQKNLEVLVAKIVLIFSLRSHSNNKKGQRLRTPLTG